MSTPDLTPLIAQACERWLAYRYYSTDTDDDGHPISHGYWRRGADFVNLPAPDGNLLVALCDAIRAKGYEVELTWYHDGSAMCILADTRGDVAAAQDSNTSPLEALLKAAAEVLHAS